MHRFSQHINKISHALVGENDSLHFEHRFINSLTFFISLASFTGFIINVSLNISKLETFLTLINGLIYLSIYCLSRLFNKHQLAKWSALIAAYIMLSILWLNSGGTEGPIPYTYFLLLLSVVLLTDGWSRYLLLAALAINVGLLFYLESENPERLIQYASDTARRLDLLSSMLLYFVLGAIIMGYAKKNYVREKQNAQKADKLKTAFLANVSHEIRTPMNAIMGFTGLMQKTNLSDEKRKRYQKTVEDNIDYLLRLIDDILDIAQIESDELSILPKKIDLNEFLESIEISHNHLITNEKKKTIKLFFEKPNTQTVLYIDDTRLEQIFSNLISNSIKFTREGFIKFGYTPGTHEIVFFVQDTGIGISEEDKDSVFDRFVKLDPAKFEMLHRGTGIGLSIAKKVVEYLGGTIWFDSSVGEGTIFYFRLPKGNKPQA